MGQDGKGTEGGKGIEGLALLLGDTFEVGRRISEFAQTLLKEGDDPRVIAAALGFVGDQMAIGLEASRPGLEAEIKLLRGLAAHAYGTIDNG